MKRVRGVQCRGSRRAGQSPNQGHSKRANERQLHPVDVPSKKMAFLLYVCPLGGALLACYATCSSAILRTVIRPFPPCWATMPYALGHRCDLNHRKTNPLIRNFIHEKTANPLGLDRGPFTESSYIALYNHQAPEMKCPESGRRP
jgi:hypothetical protein